MNNLRIALCQLNLGVGNLTGNRDKILDALTTVEDQGATLALFPELAVTSYPAEDLLLKPGFVEDNVKVLNEIAAATKTCTALVGFAMPGAVDSALVPIIDTSDKGMEHRQPGGADTGTTSVDLVSEEARWPGLYNAVAVLANGIHLTQALKSHLPNYAVFDEHRYFAEGAPYQPISISGARVGIAICEDLWVEDKAVQNLRFCSPDLVAHLNASPYYAGKHIDRRNLLKRRAREFNCPIAYVNLVGGQDELVFDGGSMIVSPEGEILAEAERFKEDILLLDLELEQNSENPGEDDPQKEHSKDGRAKILSPHSPGERSTRELDRDEEIYEALVLGTRDYVRKNGFEKVLIGISGGIDSALVVTIAADALGAENVNTVAMPSRFSSDESFEDASTLAQNLGVNFTQIPIEKGHSALLEMLEDYMADDKASQLAAENIQARLRGTMLMALSNIKGWLVLTTSNKSENAVGYSTLYGDTAGGFSVIKDLWKLDVYRVARARNARSAKPLIPERIFTKPPTAELRPDQRDDQSLPPYEQLDPILKALVEDDHTLAHLMSVRGGEGEGLAQGSASEPELDSEIAKSLSHLLDKAEYKRRQAPPGVRISSKAFGKDRRLPITNFYI